MNGKNFNEIINLIVREDSRYDKSAYHFMRESLDFTLQRIREKEEIKGSRHISGKELCYGLRDFALKQFGPMAFTLLNEWGIRQTEDIGEIVFNLVEYEVFGKTEEDNPKDFVAVYNFEETFKLPYEPKNKPVKRLRKATKSTRHS